MNGVRLSGVAELQKLGITEVGVHAVTVGSGGWEGEMGGGYLKKELLGGMQAGGGCSATGIYLTKHSCHAVAAYVCVCLEREKEKGLWYHKQPGSFK